MIGGKKKGKNEQKTNITNRNILLGKWVLIFFKMFI